MQDEIAVAFRSRILSYIKVAEEALEFIFLIDVVIVFEHGEGEALAKAARAYEEEIHVRFFYFLYEWSLVNIVTISFYYILEVLHSVWDALAINPFFSFYFCHIRSFFAFSPAKLRLLFGIRKVFLFFHRDFFHRIFFCHADFADGADSYSWEGLVPQISQIYTDSLHRKVFHRIS